MARVYDRGDLMSKEVADGFVEALRKLEEGDVEALIEIESGKVRHFMAYFDTRALTSQVAD